MREERGDKKCSKKVEDPLISTIKYGESYLLKTLFDKMLFSGRIR